METDYATIIQPISQYFGINTQVIGIIVVLSIAVILQIIVAKFAGWLLSTFALIPVLIVGTFLGYLSIWITMLFGVVIIAFFIFQLIIDDTESEFATDSPQGTDKWIEYGNKLKLAYASKFGGENPGFNEEVDKRIAIMQNNGRGFTRSLAWDWLKRMHKFTEAK